MGGGVFECVYVCMYVCVCVSSTCTEFTQAPSYPFFSSSFPCASSALFLFPCAILRAATPIVVVFFFEESI